MRYRAAARRPPAETDNCVAPAPGTTVADAIRRLTSSIARHRGRRRCLGSRPRLSAERAGLDGNGVAAAETPSSGLSATAPGAVAVPPHQPHHRPATEPAATRDSGGLCRSLLSAVVQPRRPS